MKLLILTIAAAVALTSSTLADVFHTNVLNPGDPPLNLNVPDGQVLTVIDYLGKGNGDSALSVAKDGKSTIIRYPTDISIINIVPLNLVVAGPATVTVTSGSVIPQDVVVTYRLDPNTRKFASHAD